MTIVRPSGAGNKSRDFDVRDFGAVGNGSTDDTTAIQAAATAAIAASGTLLFSAPPSAYKIVNTISLVPPSGQTQFRMDIEMRGDFGAIAPSGMAGKSVFRSLGWKTSRIQGVKVNVVSQNNVTVWDLDVEAPGTGARASTSNLNFVGCHSYFNGTSGGCTAYRLGHGDTSGHGDMSYYQWYGCTATGNSTGTGSIAFLSETQNAVAMTVFGGAYSNFDSVFTNVSSVGAGSAQGGADWRFYGVGSTDNKVCDYVFKTAGVYLISGGRYEKGKRFVDTPNGGSSGIVSNVRVESCMLTGYQPTDEILFAMSNAGSLTLDAMTIKPSGLRGSYTAAMITLATGSTRYGSLRVTGGSIDAADPFYTIASGNWTAAVNGVVQQASDVSVAAFTPTSTGTGGSPFIPGSVGQWYVSPIAHATRSLAPTQNLLMLHPFFSGATSITIDQLDCYVNTVGATGAVLRAGIYKITNQEQPFKWANGTAWASLLVDAGTVATDSGTGQKLITLGTPLVIPAITWFAVAGVEQGGASSTRQVGGSAGAMWYSPLGGSAAVGYGTTGGPGLSITRSSVTAALPATFTPNAGAPANIDSGVGIHRSA